MPLKSDPELGVNSWLEDELYQQYLHDHSTVDESWKHLFETNGGEAALKTPTPSPQPRGAPARIAENMSASLSIPLATPQRTIAVKVMDENRRIINQHRTLLGNSKVSYTHLLGWAVIRALEELPALNHAYAEKDGAVVQMLRCAVLCLTMLSLAPAVSFGQAVSSISPTSASVSGTGGTGTVSVSAPANVAWTAISSAAWIRIYYGITGTGNGSFGYSVSANLTQSPRTGSVLIGGQTFTVNQDAGAASFPITWTPIGPHHIPGAPGDSQSGKLQALAVYYSNPNIMYAGGGIGSGNEGPLNETGAFKTTDGGLSWTSINSGLTDPIIDALWVDQTDPNTVLAGTETSGIFKSVNGGQTWSLAANLGATSDFVSANGSLLAATAAGIAQSTDSGTKWTMALPTASTVRTLASGGGAAIAGLDDGTVLLQSTPGGAWNKVLSNSGRFIWSVAIDSASPQIAYAVVGPGPSLLLVATLDGGNTWSTLTVPVLPQAIAMGSAAHVLHVAGSGSMFSTADSGQSWTASQARDGIIAGFSQSPGNRL